MSRVSIAARTRLSMLLMRRGLRSASGRMNAHPLIRWRFFSPKTDRLVIAPQDLRTADPTRASEIYSGRFAFAGKIVICDGRSVFAMAPPSDEWALQLLEFGWLRHLRAAESAITRANGRALIDEWIALQGSWHATAWRPEILARRIISWLSHAPLVLNDADVQFYRRFMRSLARQVRYLRHVVGEAREGTPRLQALVALTFAALCLDRQQRHLRGAVKRLVEEVQRQILPDGGHISRNPEILIELLLDLLPLRQAFASRNVPPPEPLLNAIDRMMPMLRFFRHGDGNFALFNGMGPTSPDVLATLLAYDDARGNPVANATHSGYQRAETRDTLLVMDTGRSPAMAVSQEAHAGCLSFEFSSRQHRIVVNCGLPAVNRDAWREVARATAAHSTVEFNGTSSCQFLESGSFRRLIGVPIVSGPTEVPVQREERDGGTIMRVSHNGYARAFGVILQRTVMLAADGARLDGEDYFIPAEGEALPSGVKDEFAVRFHLHPTIKASKLTDGHGIMLMLPNRDVWTLNAYEDYVDLEESVYLAGNDGPRRTLQIVIFGHARRVQRVHWTFAHATPAGGSAPRRSRGDEPELPL